MDSEKGRKPILLKPVSPQDEVILDMFQRGLPPRMIARAVGWKTGAIASRHIRRLRSAGHPRAIRRDA